MSCSAECPDGSDSADYILMQDERVNMALGQKYKCKLLSSLCEYKVLLIILDRVKKEYIHQINLHIPCI